MVTNAYQTENTYDNIPGKLNSLAEEYKQRQQRMDDRLKMEIENHQIAKAGKSLQANKLEFGPDLKIHKDKANPSPLTQNESYTNQQKPQQYFRSQRAVAMRINDSYDNQLSKLEGEKLQLIQKLNEALMQLDKLNQEKSHMSNQMIEISKFVRDLSRETTKGEDLNSVVNDDLRSELRSEKELSHQLKEELKTAEMERVRILTKVNELQHVYEHGEIFQSDLSISYTFKSRTYAQIEEEYHDVLQRIRGLEDQIDQVRAEVLSNEEQIQRMKHEIDRLYSERGSLQDKISILQERYESTVYNYQNERHDIDNLQRRHIKLLSTNILFWALSDILQQNMTCNFQSLQYHGEIESKNIKGLKIMRKLVKTNRRNRLKRYLNELYRTALKPLKNLRQLDDVSWKMRIKDPQRYTFYKWQLEFQRGLAQKHVQRQIIQRLLMAKGRYHERVQKHYLIRWRDRVKYTEEDKYRILKKFVHIKHRHYIRKGFTKWLQTSLDLDHQLQLNCMALRFSKKAYLGQLFSRWRGITSDLKTRRLTNLGRIWKTLKAYSSIQKQMKRQTWSILREERLRRTSLAMACFDAFRQNKEEEKLAKSVQILYDAEIPQKEKTLDYINKMSQIENFKQKSQGLNIISKHLAKYLYSYFNQWKAQTDKKQEFLTSHMSSMILKVYLTSLRQSFNKWVSYRGDAQIYLQEEVIQEQEQMQSELTAQLAQDKQVVVDKTSRKITQSGKQMKKILQGLMQRQLRDKFVIWKMNSDFKDRVQINLETVVKRRDIRLKRLAFNKYKEQISNLKRALKNEDVIKQLRLRKDNKELGRVFEAIRSFASNHSAAKRYFMRLIQGLDLSLKENIFKKWHRFAHYENERLMQDHQKERVENISELVDEVGTKSDQLETLAQQNNKIQKTLASNARRQIRLAFQRCIEGTHIYGFEKWKSFVNHQQRQELLLKRSITRMHRNLAQHGFQTWRLNASQQVQFVQLQGIEQEQFQIETVTNESNLNQKVYNAHKDECSNDIQKSENESQQLGTKHQNCLKLLIAKVDTNLVVSRKRYILQEWRRYIKNRKRCFMLMEMVVKKTLWQVGMNELIGHGKQVADQQNVKAKIYRMTDAIRAGKMRVIFAQWIDGCKSRVNTKRILYEKETAQLVKERSKLVVLVQKRVEEQLIQSRHHLKLFDTFGAWKSFISARRILIVKVNTYRAQEQDRDKNRLLNKWIHRHKSTQKFKRVKCKIDKTYSKGLVQTCFQSILFFNQINRELTRKLSLMASSVDRVFAFRAFRLIKTEGESRSYLQVGRKLKGGNILNDVLDNALLNNLKNALIRIRIHSLKKHKLGTNLKSTLKYYFIRKAREYFLTWKQESDRRMVRLKVEQEGPVAVESFNLKHVMYNLRQALLEEGIEPSKIQRVIDSDKVKNLRHLEKSICRLFCYKDRDLYLMPSCLDRWKSWVQHRKIFKYWLNYLEKRVDPGKVDLYQAFRKWRQILNLGKVELKHQKRQALLKIFTKHQININRIDTEIQAGEETIQDLSDQRDILLKRYVGSQKLALAVTKASCVRAQQRTLSRWVQHVGESNAAVFEDALRLNLNRIQHLKDKIRGLERSNNHLSDQNEELRTNALDGIEMAKQVDDLTREREKLGINLGDKAIIIRKLLEDNNNLSVRLGNAQEEAQNLIRLSQMRLNQQEEIYM